MVINNKDLLKKSPIENMIDHKIKDFSVSRGLGEAGYDISIKQNIVFNPNNGFPEIYLEDPVTKEKKVLKGKFTLASSIERFTMPNDLIGIVHDKSTWARKGLSVFNTVIESGWSGFLTLELVYHGQDILKIPAGAGIAQVVFHKISYPISYDGKYQNQGKEPQEAIWEK